MDSETEIQTGHPATSDTGFFGFIISLEDRPWFKLSIAMVVLGIVLGIGATIAYAYGQDVMWQILGILSLGFSVIGAIGMYFLRLSNKQYYYLDLINHERIELECYHQLLTDLKGEGEFDDRSIDLAETVYKIEAAQEQLDRAEHAVFREGYVAFLSSFYRANVLRIFIYDHLDAAKPIDEPQHISWLLNIGLEESPDLDVREEGTIDVPPSDETDTRIQSLSKWLWSTSRSLPEPTRSEVDEHLLGPDNKPKQSYSPQALYRAISIIHAWDLQRLSALMSLKRALRMLAPILAGLLIVVIAVEMFTDVIDSIIPSSPAGSWFVLAVIFAGFLGSMFSMALSMRDTSSEITSHRTIPDPSILRETLITSLLIGGISALVLYAFVLSDVGDTIFTPAIRGDPLAILFIAFLGGYSERLVQRSLDKAEEMVEKSDDERPVRPSGRVPSEQRPNESV